MKPGPILAGIDTEYGFTVEGRDVNDQRDDSMALVDSFPGSAFIGWDYSREHPRRDMRGFEVQALAHDPVDAQFDLNRSPSSYGADERADRVLTNGARFYNDHGHPEYATPECWTLRELAAHDRFGEDVATLAAKAFTEKTGRAVRIYKNNSDFKGASFGTHESYLFPRDIPFEMLAEGLMPILVARSVLTGAGKVGSESKGPVRFQLSQRADFLAEPMNVETLARRPVFNTRDEPHGGRDRWRRVHVISGDSNMHPGCTIRKAGLVQIALELIRHNQAPVWRIPDPVRSFQLVSRDAVGEGRIELEGASWTTPRQVLESYAEAYLALAETAPELRAVAEESLRLLEARESDFDAFWPSVDWAAKRWLLDQFAESESRWDQTTMQSLDLAYHLLDDEEGLYRGLESAGVLDLPDLAINADRPPNASRAQIRGLAVERFRDEIETMAWGVIKFRDRDPVSLPPDRRYDDPAQSVESVEQLIHLLTQNHDPN